MRCNVIKIPTWPVRYTRIAYDHAAIISKPDRLKNRHLNLLKIVGKELANFIWYFNGPTIKPRKLLERKRQRQWKDKFLFYLF